MMTTGGTIMPKYNYSCEVCNKEWTRWSSMDDPSVECPHCFSKKVKKIPSIFFVIKNDEHEKKISSKQNVVEHIEENRKILKEIKQESGKDIGVKDV